MIDVPVLVKDALRDGRRLKNYRVLVLNDDGTTDFVIDNNTLVKETMSFDERMCSGDTIKFGLCEGTSCEFQYFNHPSIYNRRIQVLVDVQYEVFSLDYETIQQMYKFQTATITVDGQYRIYSAEADAFDYVWILRDGAYIKYTPIVEGESTVCQLECLVGDVIEVEWSLSVPDTFLQQKTTLPYHSIPMGFFTVEKCARQASTGIMKVTAYNKLRSDYLDAKANNILDSEFSNPDDTVTLFDIKRLLLGEYEISEEYDVETVSDISDASYGRKVRGSALSFRSTYGIESPINYYEYRYQRDTTASAPANSFYVYFDELDRRVLTDPTKVYQFQFDGIDVERYETDFFEKFVSEFTKAINITENNFITMLMTPYSDSGSGQGNYEKWLGYHQLLGLEIVFNDNENYYLCTRHYYSKYAYQYGLANVMGSLTDATKKVFTNVRGIEIHVPRMLTLSSSSSNRIGTYNCDKYIWSVADYSYKYYTNSGLTTSQEATIPKWMWLDDKNINLDYYQQNTKLLIYDNLPSASLVSVQIDQIPEFTLRDIASAIYETECQFGKLDRETDLFSGVELNYSGLYPAEDLYPDNALYPGGAALSSEKSMYSKLWADEGNVQKWRNLIITYNGLDEEQHEKEFTLQRQINADGTQDYNMSDNWLFKNLIWTAEDVGDYADAMVLKMKDITWFPFEMWCAGLPYLETGDEIEMSIGETTYTSYVLQRQLKGIQNLQDTYINGTLDIF